MEVVVGRVLRAHGLRGEVAVAVRTDDPERRFAVGAVLATDPSDAGPLTVATARPHGARMLVTFAEVDDREAAERLRGVDLLVDVPAGERPVDPEEYYDHQLTGLTVVTTDGTRVGQVSEMLHLPGQEVVVVRRAGGGEVLVPFVSEIVTDVDLGRGRMVVEPPPGLLDLSHPEEG